MRFLLTLLFICFNISCFSQGLQVEKLSLRVSDVSARTKPRLDPDGKECALIKVYYTGKNALFNEAIGDVENQTNEYWVYIKSGSNKLTISIGEERFLISFSDYGIANVESKTTYELRIINNLSSSRFTHHSKPSDFLEDAEKGNAEAQCNVGKCHYYGYGVVQDYYVALSWFRKSATHDNAESQYYIGKCFYYGQGFHKSDYEQAIIWLKKSANNNNADAQYLLGICFEKGQGVKKNEKEAKKLFEIAAMNGNAEAKAKLNP